MLQPASRRAARHTSTNALKRFFAIADAWELSPLQQCRLLKIPSPQVLERYRLGQAPRLSATQQERAALIANIQYSLTAEPGIEGSRLGLGARTRARRRPFRRRQPAVLHAGKRPAGAAGSGPAAGSRKRTPLAGPANRARGPDSAILESCSDANVAELVDAPDLGSGGATRASSSLAFRTNASVAVADANHYPRGLTCRFPSRVSANWSAACKCRCRPNA